MTLIVVLNGEPPSASLLKKWVAQGPLYVADGGSASCLNAGITPRIVVGDFDSMDPESFPSHWERMSLPDQNASDFQKVLSVLPPHPSELVILGGLGRRLDHTLTNLLIAGSVEPGCRLRFIGEREVLIRVTPETPYESDSVAGETVSLLPLQDVGGVTTSGLRWNLNDRNMGPGGQLGQSNETLGAFRVSVRHKWLWVWRRVDDDSLQHHP